MCVGGGDGGRKFILTARPLICPVIIPIPLGGFSIVAPQVWRIVLKLLGLPQNLFWRIVKIKKNRPDMGGTKTRSRSQSGRNDMEWICVFPSLLSASYVEFKKKLHSHNTLTAKAKR